MEKVQAEVGGDSWDLRGTLYIHESEMHYIMTSLSLATLFRHG